LTSYVASIGYNRESQNPDVDPQVLKRYKMTQDISALTALFLTIVGAFIFFVMKKPSATKSKWMEFLSGTCASEEDDE